MWICINMQRITLFHWFVLEKRLIKKSWKLWPISPISGKKSLFSKKFNMIFQNIPSWGFLAPRQNLEKPNDPIPRKHPDREHDRKKDTPYFIGPFWLLPGVQQVHWSRLAFKIQIYRLRCQSNQTLLHHSQHKKISSIHK